MLEKEDKNAACIAGREGKGHQICSYVNKKKKGARHTTDKREFDVPGIFPDSNHEVHVFTEGCLISSS